MDFVSTLCGHVLAWSPNGKLLAATAESKLQIRDSESLEVIVLMIIDIVVVLSFNLFLLIYERPLVQQADAHRVLSVTLLDVHSFPSTGIADMDMRGQNTADRVGLRLCSNTLHHV